MPDMLVKLYNLDMDEIIFDRLKEEGVEIRRAMAPDKHLIIEWVSSNFHAGWASECEVAFANKPISCFIAVKSKEILGFACYDATMKDFFGPTGVSEAVRGKGVGKALLLKCLNSMKETGYAYAIIGGARSNQGFYGKVAGAIPIEGSEPGIYKNMVKYD